MSRGTAILKEKVTPHFSPSDSRHFITRKKKENPIFKINPITNVKCF